MMNLSKDFLLAFGDKPSQVDCEIVEAFNNTSDAIKWSFLNRPQPEFRSLHWIANQLGMRRATLSRLINHGDFKLDASLIPAWDFLVGNKAVSQFIESEKTKLIDAITQTQLESIKLVMKRSAA